MEWKVAIDHLGDTTIPIDAAGLQKIADQCLTAVVEVLTAIANDEDGAPWERDEDGEPFGIGLVILQIVRRRMN